MEYQNIVTKEEASILAAALLCEFNDPEICDPLHVISLHTEAANSVLYAMRVLHSKDEPVNVISVYEYLQLPTSIERFGDIALTLTLPVITAIAQEVRSRAETLALIDVAFDMGVEVGE